MLNGSVHIVRMPLDLHRLDNDAIGVALAIVHLALIHGVAGDGFRDEFCQPVNDGPLVGQKTPCATGKQTLALEAKGMTLITFGVALTPETIAR